MKDIPKGRIVFIPDGSDDAYEIDIEELIHAQRPTLFSRFVHWLNSLRKDPPAELNKITSPTAVDIPILVCDKLEELFCTAVWYTRDEMFDTAKPSYILSVFPRDHADGWEPIVKLALTTGTPKEISLAELLTYYVPLAPDEEDFHS